MLDQGQRLTQVETQLTERSREAEVFRAEIKASLGLLVDQQIRTVARLGELTAIMNAHLAEDRHLLQRVNGNHRQERLVQMGQGAGVGGAVVTAVIALAKAMGWF